MRSSKSAAFRHIAPLLALSVCAVSAETAPVTDDEPLPALDQLPSAELQDAAAVPIGAAPSSVSGGASQNVTINLINRLVKRGVLTKEDADDLMKLAEADAAAAKAEQEALRSAHEAETADPVGEDDVRVTYVPESVKAQMRAEIKHEVMAQAREENWAAPRAMPGWVTKYNVFGDIRVRAEGLYFPDGNDNTGAFPNFNAINTGAPFDVSGTEFSPQLNVDQDRERIRLRARVGAEVDLEDNFSAGLRLATGENNSPVSTNQSFGGANQGQGGNFSKYSIWLDRAYLKYDFLKDPDYKGDISVGRFDNPFFSSEVMWDEDLGFDGISAKGKTKLNDCVTGFYAGGAFPVFNTDLNFSSNQPEKFKSTDKWLYGGQAGIEWKINEEWSTKLALAYYQFDKIEGKESTPFTPLTSNDAGDTDNTRPSFAQKGNTYRALRNIIPNASNNNGTINQWQYFGLATPFKDLVATGRVDYDGFEPVRVTLAGEFIKNVGFNNDDVSDVAVNNRGPGDPGHFEGGDNAGILNLQVGSIAMEEFGDWNAFLGYRYVESDAVVDGFTDSDFGGGGTNMKGFSIGGNMALTRDVRLGVRWMSADEIAGPEFKCDTLQFDINAKF